MYILCIIHNHMRVYIYISINVYKYTLCISNSCMYDNRKTWFKTSIVNSLVHLNFGNLFGMGPPPKKSGSEATKTPAPQSSTAVDSEDEWEEPLAVAQSTTWKFSNDNCLWCLFGDFDRFFSRASFYLALRMCCLGLLYVSKLLSSTLFMFAQF